MGVELNEDGRRALERYMEAGEVRASPAEANKNLNDFFENGGAKLMFAMFDARERREREERECEEALARRTVAVRFPDGIREVRAHYESSEDRMSFRSSQDEAGIMRLVPDAMEGWEFRESIGAPPNWHAMQVPIRDERPRYTEYDYMPDEYGFRER